MVTTASVGREQRYTRDHACPVCGGWDNQRRHRGERCWGFLLSDGTAAVCMRTQSDRELEGGWLHRLVESPRRQEDAEQVYDYRDETGALLYQVCRRRSPKGFVQRRPNGKGGWIWKLDSPDGSTVRRVPYRLSELLAAPIGSTIHIPEGEKDVDRLREFGWIATTNSEGALRWRADFAPLFRGHHVVLYEDNDLDGRKRIDVIRQSLMHVAASVRVVTFRDMEEHADVSNWVDAGHTREELLERIEAAADSSLPTHANGHAVFGEAQPANGQMHETDEGQDEAPPWTPARHLTDVEMQAAARDTWLDRYVSYCAMRTDAPAVFHEALGLVALSAAIGRRAALHLSQGALYPAIWIFLIAESTIYRKSTALDLLRELLLLVGEEFLAPNDFTPQRFVAVMAENDGKPLVFARDEFGGFYDGLNRLDFMSGLKELLCDIYDGRRFRREKQRPKDRKAEPGDVRPERPDGDWKYDIKEPFLSIAAGTTLERFTQVARVEDVHSGFLPRFALVVPDGPPRGDQDVGELTPAMETALKALVEELRGINNAVVAMHVERAVFSRFNAYTRAVEREAAQAPNSNLVAIVGARCTWMAFRVAVLLAASGTAGPDGVRRVECAHLLRGIDLAERWRHTAIHVLGGLAPSRFERQVTRLIGLVNARQPIGLRRRDAMRVLRVSRKEMNDLENTLEDRGELRMVREAVPGGRRVTYFKS